jgi:hypothetical protein
MIERHADGSLRIGLTDGNTVRLRPAGDGTTRLAIIGPAGGHHAAIRLTETEVNRVIVGLAMGSVEAASALTYRDAMTP